MKKKNLIVFGIFLGVLSCVSLPCLATDYNVTQYSGNDSSLTNRQTSFQTDDSATLVNDITADRNLDTLGDITFTLNGKDSNGVSHTISGNNTYSGLKSGQNSKYTINDTTFSNFTGGNGSAINNSSQYSGQSLSINNSTFKNNSASMGGAIYTTNYASQDFVITNTSFINNTASSDGGAIYAGGYNGCMTFRGIDGTVLFQGNKANGISNAISLNTQYSTNINIVTNANGKVIFDDKITSSNYNNSININAFGDGVGGEVIFNENVSNLNIGLSAGTLTFGQPGNTYLTDATGKNPSNEYLTNVGLALHGGTLNLANGKTGDLLNLTSFTSSGGATINFDADLSNGTSDQITAGSATGNLNHANINIVADGDAPKITLFTQASPTLTNYVAYTTNRGYLFTPDASVAGQLDVSVIGQSGLNYAVYESTVPRSYSATADENLIADLGHMGGSDATMNINGNSHSINGKGYAGIYISKGQTLNVDSVGSLNSDGTVNTSWNTTSKAFNNFGTIDIKNSVFSNNALQSGVNYGSILDNNQGATAKISNSTFEGNTSPNDTLILNWGDLTITNSTFKNNAYILTSTGNLTIKSSIFSDNSGFTLFTACNSAFDGEDLTISNNTSNDDTINFSNMSNVLLSSSAIKNNISNTVLSISSTNNFLISGDDFENNTTASGGFAMTSAVVAVQNNSTGTIQNSKFISNSKSGAMQYDSVVSVDQNSSVSIINSIFEDNTVSTTSMFGNGSGSGAIYSAGTTTIVGDENSDSVSDADKGTTEFKGNKLNGVSNALYINSGTVNMNTSTNGKIIFDDKIASSSIDNIININPGNTLNSGEVVFNENVSNATINVDNGTLTFGQNGNTYLTDAAGTAPSNEYTTNVNLNLVGGTLNLGNGKAEDVLNVNKFTSTENASLVFDTDLSTGITDSINAATASGTLNVSKINVLADGLTKSILVFTNAAPIINSYTAYTDGYSYKFTQDATIAGQLDIVASKKIDATGLYAAVNGTDLNRGFSAIKNETENQDLGNLAVANSTLDIFGNKFDINGNSHAGITVSAGQTLNISGVGSLNSDGTVKTSLNNFTTAINNSGTTSIENSVFYNNSKNGTSIVNTGDLAIKNSYFKDNGIIDNPANASSKVTISGTTFDNTAIKIESGNGALDVSGSTFENNNLATGKGGSAIYAAGSDKVSISDSMIAHNSVASGDYGYGGGAINVSAKNIDISNSTIENNSIGSYGFGGAVYANGPTISISNSTFENNIAGYDATGGAVYAMASSTNSDVNVKISNSLFKNNSVGQSGSGGAVFVSANSQNGSNTLVDISKSDFENNIGGIGGAFSACSSSMGGSALINITDSIFKNNTALNGSGAANFNLSEFSQNGGIATLNISNSDFENNTAVSAGAVMASADSQSGVVTININNSIFKNNIATADVSGSGGAILAQTSSMHGSSTININNSLFENNTANSDGGAIRASAATINIGNSTFENNTAKTDKGGAVHAMAMSEGADVSISIHDSAFVGNSANNGGAVYADAASYPDQNSKVGKASVNVDNSYFANNSATDENSAGALVTNADTTVNDSSFYNNNGGKAGAIYVQSSTDWNNVTTAHVLNIAATRKDVVFDGNKSKTDTTAIYLDTNSTLNINAAKSRNIILNDKVSSANNTATINVNKSDVMLTDGVTKAPTGGNYYINNNISPSNVNLYGANVSLGKDNVLNGSNLALNGTNNLSMINGSVGTMALNNLAVNGTTNLGIDVNLNNSTADRITSANAPTGSGRINVSAINLIGTTEKNQSIQIADAQMRAFTTYSGTSSYESPMYKYDIGYDSGSGSLNFTQQSFSPTVMAPSVAAVAGNYLTQCNLTNEVFGHLDSMMFLSKSDRIRMAYANRYAATDGQFTFSPTLLPDENPAIWTKTFTTFESVPLRNGPDVSNISYGTIVGFDSPYKQLGHGFVGYLTPYMGYTGSHQKYNDISVYQNGGLIGLTGTVYKGNFFASLTGNVGASAGNNYTKYGADAFTSLDANLALKTGYNLEFFESKLILQPSITFAYSFMKTLNYTTAADVRMTSDAQSFFQVVPGVKLIGNLKNGWQPYIGVDIVISALNTGRFYANQVTLPQASVNTYVQYGVGIQRRWKDKLTGYAQAMARGGGRNGVALQIGFRYTLGK